MGGGGGQDGCEGRIEVFVKIKKRKFGGWSGFVRGQGGCERRKEVFVKIPPKNSGGGGGWGTGREFASG